MGLLVPLFKATKFSLIINILHPHVLHIINEQLYKISTPLYSQLILKSTRLSTILPATKKNSIHPAENLEKICKEAFKF